MSPMCVSQRCPVEDYLYYCFRRRRHHLLLLLHSNSHLVQHHWSLKYPDPSLSLMIHCREGKELWVTYQVAAKRDFPPCLDSRALSDDTSSVVVVGGGGGRPHHHPSHPLPIVRVRHIASMPNEKMSTTSRHLNWWMVLASSSSYDDVVDGECNLPPYY